MFGGFNINKFKPNLKMAVNRIAIIKSKKTNGITSAKEQVASMLREGKEEKARIRVEGIIREDFTIEAYEIIELLCDLLSERAALIKAEKECPYDMREAVCTLIYAEGRVDIPELKEVKKQLVKKYGSDFAQAAGANHDGCVNERVIARLSVTPPSAYLVLSYLEKIAAEHQVDWEGTPIEETDPLTAPMAAPTGSSVEAAAGSGRDYKALYEKTGRASLGAPPSALPNLPTSSINESFGKTTAAEGTDEVLVDESPSANVPGFDELSDRFSKLRKKSSNDRKK